MKILYDIFDLNWEVTNPDWDLIEKISPSRLPSLLEGGVRAVYFFIRSFRFFKISKTRREHLFFVGSYNHLKTFQVIKQKVRHSKIITYHTYRTSKEEHIPEVYFYIIGLVFLPLSFMNIFLQDQSRFLTRPLLRRMERLVVSGPSKFVWKILFLIWQPKSVTISNDHNHWTRSCFRAANEMGIKSIYIPHAFTSEGFPPLETTFALLDSRTQDEYYQKIDTKVEIVGAIRYEKDIEKSMKSAGNSKNIMICFNEFDTDEFVQDLINEALKVIEGTIYIKAHPAEKARDSFYTRMGKKERVHLVGREESIAPYAKRCFALLAGLSGVHIDALMYGVLPVTFKEWYPEDYYGLVKKNMIVVLEDIRELSRLRTIESNLFQERRKMLNAHLEHIEKLPSDMIKDFYLRIEQDEY